MPRLRGKKWMGDAIVNGERKRLSFATLEKAQAFETDPYKALNIEPTKYYDEYIRYFALATKQQELCNFGTTLHTESNVDDDLMHHVELYDVVERKYAGFSQIINDAFYGWTEEHPYWHKMETGHITLQREVVAKDWTGKHADFKLPEWLYIFILHRVCGSAINYATKPSGYYNTLLFNLQIGRAHV